ncbi:ATP-dependent helicase HrpB [Planctobacterium marinum]|uniref:ATP-dependent helicase HrpB n=1 Tax=Planctobacterium marinum TaxID=1631968 RepID=UPI001E56138E|nr:ATP-dependent helicase HrpB [Planctobacterium marinum]MCC2603759.1 ATP-dependent helicase HrpB [Planctobacterium marinum]
MQFIQSLPISQHLSAIAAQLASHKRLVLTAEPGAGKSTAVPLYLLQQDWLEGKKILMLEPRRVAAKAIAHFLASQLGEAVGQRVGYRVKNEEKVSQFTRLEVVTEGILTRQLQGDPELTDVALVIFDEFHERSVNADLGLMLVKEVMSALREDLHCLVMSATIDSDAISNYLDSAPVLHCEGRTFPVSVRYQARHNKRLQESVWQAAQEVVCIGKNATTNRDILVFLPGQGEINRCIEYFQEKLQTDKCSLLPLYAALPLSQQQAALEPDPQGRKKIIFATNIAETSLTIDGIGLVIDSGLERQMIYDAKTGMSRLETGYIAKSSATQRSGRAGRTAEGLAIRLWSESQQQQLADFRQEEILRTDLMDTVLELAVWGQRDFQHIDWLTPPPIAHFERSVQLLTMMGFLEQSGKPSDKGKQACQLPLSPRLAAVLLAAKGEQEQMIAADICALLSEQDVLRNFHSVAFSHRLQALWQEADYKNCIRYQVLKQVKATASKLKMRMGLKHLILPATEQSFDLAARLLLAGYPDLLAKQRQTQGNTYLLANGRGAELDMSDPLLTAPWLLVLDINAQTQSGRIWLAMAISEQNVSEFAAIQASNEESVYWDDKAGAARIKISRKLGAIVYQSQISADLSLHQKQQFMLQQVKDKGLSELNWTQDCHRWLQRAAWLASVDETFPGINERALLNSLEDWLLPYIGTTTTLPGLRKVNLLPLLTATLNWEQQGLLEQYAPEQFVAPTGDRFSITYDAAQGPIVSLQLQSLFGLTATPLLGNNKVALRFELLSPARRPIQTTSDLNGFWQGSYHEVAKEMRGRYPKHRWPEQPLLEKPGKSLKKKSH